MATGLAIALKPFILAVFVLLLWGFSLFMNRVVRRYFPDGKIKRFLFQPWEGIADRKWKPPEDQG